jgi:6,7-dimethyl-8-ribityllumazine synthase
MSHELDPKVGRWYRRVDDEQLFKVVDIDEDDGLIEIKTADGEVEELDSSEWVELDLETAEAPEDYVDPDDSDDEEETEEEEADEDRPKRGRGSRTPREDWEEDEDDDDWDDDDDDGDDDYDSDR